MLTSDDVRLRAAIWNGTGRGVALLLSGRTEFLEKMAIPATDLQDRGFTVVSLDWRGQGLSDRLAEPPVMGHVEKFTDYHKDIAALMAAPEMAAHQKIDLMLAHSMGGAIGLGAIYRRVIAPRSVVLSAPMLGVYMPGVLKVAGFITTRVADMLGKLDKRPPFGDVDKPYVFEGFEGNVLTSDRAVFDWMVEALRAEPRLQLAMPSLRWLDESTREMDWLTQQGPIDPPLAIVYGGEEAVVEVGRIKAASKRLGCEVHKIPGGRHEVLIESEPMRSQAWHEIDAFLERVGV
ncbi:alpha/beta hydrolase [Rhodobacteraceae bacterium NNCM2]|nr:alpha/beta hydrolase [Coraliihabitans acroporae]